MMLWKSIKRVGSKIHWEHFDSPRAYIQPKRTRAAIVQSVVLDTVVMQLEKILNEKFFFVPKQIGVKTLSHIGHTQLQKRTGYIRRPEMCLGKETLLLVDRFLHDCREHNNWNLPLIPKKYLESLPLPILLDIPDGITELTPAAVMYHKSRFLKVRWWGCAGFVQVHFIWIYSSTDERSLWSLNGLPEKACGTLLRQSCRGRLLWIRVCRRCFGKWFSSSLQVFLLRFQALIFPGSRYFTIKTRPAVESRVTVPFHSTQGGEHVQELLQKSPVMVFGVEKCSPLLKKLPKFNGKG